MDDLLATLAKVVGIGGMLTGTDVSSRASGIWRSQGIEAKAILRPRTTAEVSRILAICNAAGQPLVAQGGLTGLVEGHITQAGEIVLSLERMNAIEEVNPVERTMTVQAGVVLEAVHNAAEAHGLMYPLDIGGRGSCTLGGNIATNAGGNRVIRYGMTRDMVLGVEAVLADGTVVSSMNRMIKNNAGYDLKQLFIGTEGSLGIVTRAVLRLREKPRSQETMFVAVSDFDRVTALLKAMDAGLGGTLSAFEVLWNNFYRLVTTPPATQKPPLPQDYPFYVLVEAMGGDPQSDHARIEQVFAEAHESGLIEDAVIATSEAQRLELWAMRDDVEQVHQYKPVFIFDVSLRVSDMDAYVAQVNRGLEATFGEYTNFVFGHIGDGNIHFAVAAGEDDGAQDGVKQAVYQPLASIGGSVSAEHGVGLDKKKYLRLSRNDEEIALMRTLKQALDPNGILNPGKIFDAAA
ncbi:MAG: FAD-binding oxidoreductase [Gammaproteobacteria bacterium]|nr:FAD-binding oxidoreductase [Gammaproteobacteria bacterium]MDE0444621.1 FAD-binding oxidoreductase [Gammaproteobacteria bacterium]